MRRHARLALSVWIAALATIVLFTIFWRVGCFRPHFFWGILTLAAMLLPLVWLAASTLWRFVRGPGRLRAIGWLLVGATPVVLMGAYVAQIIVDVHTDVPRSLNAPLRVAAVWASWIFDIEARWRYPSWTYGRHAVLIDDGRSPHPEKLVADMDRHIEAMADLLGQPVPNREFLWVRGSLFGFNGRATGDWAVCFPESAGEPSRVDRHEVAHTLITALSGPDQYPPALFAEGWAESQSTDRAEQIRYLARAHNEGRAYSLQEVVRPAGYSLMRPAAWAYWEGGPVVHYLMHRYGPKTFLRLYAGVRPARFHEDCRAILGDSWETVEEGFWKWIEAEDKLIAKSTPKPPAATSLPHVELAKSVNPADWQALLEGCRAASNAATPLPSNVAFIVDGETGVERTASPTRTSKPRDGTKFECRVVFEDRSFWLFNQDFISMKNDSFLMTTPDQNVDLTRGESGSLRGTGMGAWPRDHAARILSLYRWTGDPATFLPLRGDPANFLALRDGPQNQETWHIERLVRPTTGSAGKWKVWFTTRSGKDETNVRHEVELDPACRWQVTRFVCEEAGKWRREGQIEHKCIGGALMPVSLCIRNKPEKGDLILRWQLRPMTQVEQQDLKQLIQCVADQWKPTDPYPWLKRLLLAMVIVCPLGGLTLLAATRRREPSPATVVPPTDPVRLSDE